MKFYDRQGNVIEDDTPRISGLIRWAELMEDVEYRLVALSRITSEVDGDNHVAVYTYWVGHDLSLRPGEGTPLIFETVAAAKDGGIVTCDRWATEDDARDGHAVVVNDFVSDAGCEMTVVELDAHGNEVSTTITKP